MRELGFALLLLLRSILFDLKGGSTIAYRLFLPLVVNAGKQPLTWFSITLAAILYLSFAPIAQKWNDRDTGRSFLALLALYPLAEVLGKTVGLDITTLSIRRHLAWLAEMDDLVHEFNVIRGINAKELREFSGNHTLSEMQMRMADSQDRMVEAMGSMTHLPAGESSQAEDVPLLNLETLTHTVLLIIWGTQGGGKTTLAKLIARIRENQGHTIAIADPHGSVREWGSWAVMGSGRDYAQLDRYLRQFDAAITQDYQQYSQGKRHFAYSTLLVDEFTQWADRCKSSAAFVKSACSDLRKIHRCVILITHSDTITGLGDAKGLRDAIDRSAVKLQLETRMTGQGEYQPTGYGWLQYPGQDKQRVKIPKAVDFALPAATNPVVEIPLGDRLRLEHLYQHQTIEHPLEEQLYEKSVALFLRYFHAAKTKYGDREGWVSVTKLHQNWGKRNGLNAEEFSQFLCQMNQLGLGRFHPENSTLWTVNEPPPN